MNFYIQQTIHISNIRIGGLTNSSVFQIGSAGIIKPASFLYNTGGFQEPAPQASSPGGTPVEAPAVPLSSPGVTGYAR
jgi:spore germination protein PB